MVRTYHAVVWLVSRNRENLIRLKRGLEGVRWLGLSDPKAEPAHSSTKKATVLPDSAGPSRHSRKVIPGQISFPTAHFPLLGIVSTGFEDLAVCIEEKQLSSHSFDAAVIDYETIDADQHRMQFKLQGGHLGERFRPIGTDRGFPFQHTRRFSSNLNDIRREHFEVVSVVRQNSG